MKIPFIIYLQALGIYLLATLPAIFVPAIYMLSAWYAFTSGFAAMVFFVAVFLILKVTRPPIKIVKYALVATVAIAVAVAYKLLLMVAMPYRGFLEVDVWVVFPMAAVVSGWVAVAINMRKVSEYFSPPVLEEWETLFTYQQAKV